MKVLVDGACIGVEKHPDLELLTAVPNDDPDSTKTTLTEGAKSFASVLTEEIIENVRLAAFNDNTEDAKKKSAPIQKISSDIYTIV